jgi:hypothetical protein
VDEGKGCSDSTDANVRKSWCYVRNQPEAKCRQATEFGPDAIAEGAQVFIQCINQEQQAKAEAK